MFSLFKKHPYKRRYKFIDKRQQVRFAVDVALHSLLFPVFFLTLVILTPISTWLMGSDADRLRPVILEFLRISIDHWWVIAIALAFVAYFSVLFSHRIVGPMRRFENALVAKRDNPSMQVSCGLRSGDYFHDFSTLLEEVLNGNGPESQRQDTQESQRRTG